MPFHIEILSIGGDFDDHIAEACQILNGAQNEFSFRLSSARLRSYGRVFVKTSYTKREVFDFLKRYRVDAKGDHPYLVGVVGQYLEGNLFGSHNARTGQGEAVVTMHDQERFVESSKLYLSYYLIRYALSFVCPLLRNHDDTRGCFFDRKGCKRDIKKSIDSGAFCGECTAVLWQSFNEEIYLGIQGMIEVMKALRADSQDILPATSLKGQVDIGIITIREDEFEAVRDRFPSRRNVNGKANYYSYAEIKSKAGEKLRVVVTRSPEQGQGAAQAVAADMIAELSPPWIFLVGIAGGFPAPEYTLGDVLLSQRMHDFAVSAAIENKALEFQDMGGPMTIEVEKLVAGLKGFRHLIGPWSEKEFLGMSKPDIKSLSGWRSTSLYGKRTWRSKVVDSLKGHFPSGRASRVPDFFAAVIITGNALLKDTKLATIWRQTARHASGVEMELGGVCRAARHGADGRTHVLAIRGLSDIVGYKRSHEWTEFACRSAAAFADALLRSGIIRRRKSSP